MADNLAISNSDLPGLQQNDVELDRADASSGQEEHNSKGGSILDYIRRYTVPIAIVIVISLAMVAHTTGSTAIDITAFFESSSSGSSTVNNVLNNQFDTRTEQPASSNDASTTSRPNFIFFLIDDLPWNAIGYQNFDFSGVTPNIKRFAEEDGIIIDRYYAQELCTPSRASLMTGRYPSTIGRQFDESFYDQIGGGLRLGERLLPEVLRDHGGYKNYMLGKWNLGNSDVRYLPTRRGFHEFLGFLGGGINGYSKVPGNADFDDFMYSDGECYERYTGEDHDLYSTLLFRNKAVDAIEQHDFDKNPMFLYLAFHAVHSPLDKGAAVVTDLATPCIERTTSGDSSSSLSEEQCTEQFVVESSTITPAAVGDRLIEQINYMRRQQIAAVMYLVDRVVRDVHDAVAARGQEQNSYFIVASDNGGCPYSGGMNGPLRGSKGSLFEGGTRVDAMMFGKALPAAVRGTRYNGLMHTSDWFPTLLQLAGITDYAPPIDNALDGVSQAAAMLSNTAAIPATAIDFNNADSDSSTGISSSTSGSTSSNGGGIAYPRSSMLYNVYYHVSHMPFDLNNFTSAAVRNDRYKLIHSYVDSELATWFQPALSDVQMAASCDAFNILSGSDFRRSLFDLEADPYEQHDLYDDSDYVHIKAELTAELIRYANAAAVEERPTTYSAAAEYFSRHGGFVQPFQFLGNSQLPLRCSKSTVFHPMSDSSEQNDGVDATGSADL